MRIIRYAHFFLVVIYLLFSFCAVCNEIDLQSGINDLQLAQEMMHTQFFAGNTTPVLETYEQIIQKYEKYPTIVSSAYLGKARLYLLQEDFTKAISCYQALLENLGEEQHLIPTEKITVGYHVKTSSLEAIAKCYENQYDYEKAISYYQKVREYIEKTPLREDMPLQRKQIIQLNSNIFLPQKIAECKKK